MDLIDTLATIELAFYRGKSRIVPAMRSRLSVGRDDRGYASGSARAEALFGVPASSPVSAASEIRRQIHTHEEL
jgi:hypothetical protein